MAVLQGFKGNIKLGADAIAEMNEWDMDIDRDTYETTSFSTYDGTHIPWKTYVAGLNGASGKFSGNLDMTDTDGQLAIWQHMTTSDEPLDVDLYVDATHKFSASLFVNKMSTKVPVGDLQTVEFSFQVTDAVAFA